MKYLGLIWMLLCLTGCGRLQLEDRLLVISMGLERAEGGALRLSAQVPVYGGQEGEGDYLVISGEGDTWQTAMEALEAATPHRLSFGQTRQVVVNERLAGGDELLPLLRQVYRRHQIRANAYVVVTPSPCREFMEKQKPDTGGHLGKYLDTAMKNLVARQYAPEAALGLTLRDFAGEGMDPPLIRAVLEEGKPRYLGAALTAGGRVVGSLDGHETRLLALLTGGGRRIGIAASEGRQAEVSAFKGAGVSIAPDGALGVTLKAVAYTPATHSPEKEAIEAALEKELTALIGKLQRLNSDAAGFGRRLLWGVRTLEEMESRAWDFQTAPVTVNVDVQTVLSAT